MNWCKIAGADLSLRWMVRDTVLTGRAAARRHWKPIVRIHHLAMAAVLGLAACASPYQHADGVAKYRKTLTPEKTQRMLAALFTRSSTNNAICGVGAYPVEVNAPIRFAYPMVTTNLVEREYEGSTLVGGTVLTRWNNKIVTVTIDIRPLKDPGRRA